MPPRVLVFTDIVDSTRLAERLGHERAVALWAEHDRRARDLMARHGAREIERTDGFIMLFDRMPEAAAFASDYHEATASLGLAARASMHVGPVVVRENQPADVARGAQPVEVDGLANAIVARIMSLAAGGRTLLSAAAREALDAVPPGTVLRSQGHFRLKGIEAPMEVFELAREAAAFAPLVDAEKAYRVVRRDDLWLPVRDVRTNLAAERDAFVGRATDLRALADRLDSGMRLVTVLGVGGTGKTRLVRRYGLAWLGDWPGGVYFCDLSDARSVEGIHYATASALAIPLGRDPDGQLADAIAGRGRCLVILDNFEQVVEHAAATVGRWLDRAPEASFVVTSRERLHLPGEHLFPVEPLGLERDAIDLFVERARATRPAFAFTEGNRDAVAEVVRLLDGLPLAIELAAARIGTLSPAQLVDRMRDRFVLLAGARGAAARHATLRAAIDWSYELLAPWEQHAFAQCATFSGGFTLHAAESVLELARWSDAPPILDVVQALADKSLIRTWMPEGYVRYDIDEPYFGMYLSIREYAQERLGAFAHPEMATAHARHGRYFARFGTDEALDALESHGGVQRHRMLGLELDNLVTACRRAIGRKDAQTAVSTLRAAWAVLVMRGPYAVATELGAQVLGLTMDDALRAAAAEAVAAALRRSGRVADAEALLAEALGLARACADASREARILTRMGDLARERGRRADAYECYEDALRLALRIGDQAFAGRVRNGLGLLDRMEGRLDSSRAHLSIALEVARDAGNRHDEGIVHNSLAMVDGEAGDLASARAHLATALAIARETGDLTFEGAVESNLGVLHIEERDAALARAHLEVAARINREVGDRRFLGVALGNLGLACLLDEQLTEAQDHFEQSLAIARDVHDADGEAAMLRELAALRERTRQAGDP